MRPTEHATLRIALLGAESTGKSWLAHALAEHYRAGGATVQVVDEVLREWCARQGRTPRPEEQMDIAQEQERRVDAAVASGAPVVIADTTALMVAIYSAMLFTDHSLYRFALARQHAYDLTLVTGLDLPWVADGLQRDGPHVREPVDRLVRQALAHADVPYRVVYGSGAARLDAARRAIGTPAGWAPGRILPDPDNTPTGKTPPPAGDPVEAGGWSWACEKCGDPQCEHRLFRRLLPSTTIG